MREIDTVDTRGFTDLDGFEATSFVDACIGRPCLGLTKLAH